MNVIGSGYLYAYGNAQQEEIWSRKPGHKSDYKSVGEKPYEEISASYTDSTGISAMDAYESMGGGGKLIPEAEQGVMAECEASTKKIEIKKVIDIGVVTLFEEGVNLEFNNETGEVSCVKLNTSVPGGQVLWSKVLSPEEMMRCDALFENYPNYAKGYFEFRYRAYLTHEEFWDMYLEGKVDLEVLRQREVSCREDELYDKFLQDMRSWTE